MSESITAPKSRLRSNISWNFASGIASIFGLLLLYPLAVRIAGPEPYGIWVLAFGAIQLFSQADFGLGTGIVRTLANISPEDSGRATRRRFVTVAGTLFAILGVALTGLCFVSVSYYLQQISMTPEIRQAVPFVVTVASFSLFVAVMGRFANSTLWAEDRPDIERKATLLGLAVRAVGLLLGLDLGYGLVYVVAVEAISIAIPSLICGAAVLRRYGLPSFNREAFRRHANPLMRVSGVLFVGTFASVAAAQLPLYIVAGSLGLTATTAFGALMRVFQSAKLAISWLTNPFTHLLASNVPVKDAVSAVEKCYKLTVVASVIVSIPLVVLPHQFLSVWMGESFVFAGPSLALVAIAVLSNALILPSALIGTLRASPWPSAILGLAILILTATAVHIGTKQGSLYWATCGLVLPLAIAAPAYFIYARRAFPLNIGRKGVVSLFALIVGASLLAVATAVLSNVLTDILALTAYAILVLLACALVLLSAKALSPKSTNSVDM